MTDLSAFPITQRWPAQHPDRLQLYGLPTPNGVKVSIMLEEIGLPYEPHTIDIGKNETWTPEFLSLNPNGKIPAIIDPDGPGGKPFGLFESGAILVYLAEKTGKFLSKDPATRYETLAWVFFQMAAIGPMFGQVGFFHKFAGREYEDKRPRDRYVAEVQAPAGRSGNPAGRPRLDHGRRIHDRRHRHPGLGAQHQRLLRGWRTGRLRQPQARAGLVGTGPGPSGRPARAGDPQAPLGRAMSPRRG
jgi:glutathione S-transferase